MKSIKVEFKGQLVNLGTGLNSLDQISKQLIQRFPRIITSSTPLLFFLAASPSIQIKSLEEVKSDKTIKLIAKIAQNTEDSLIQEESFANLDSERLPPPTQKIEEGSPIISKVSILGEDVHGQYQRQYYTCFRCQGRGFTTGEGYLAQCILCNGRKYLREDHEGIKLLDSIIRSRLNLAGKMQQKEAEILKIQSPKRKLSQMPKLQNLSIQVWETSSIYDYELNKPFKRKFIFKNNGESDWPQIVKVVDCETGEQDRIQSLKRGETKILEFGPFVCEVEGRLQRSYFAYCEIDGKQVRIGHKFGFAVNGIKPVKVTQLRLDSTQKLRQLKKAAGSSKSEEYLYIKLKQIGIDLTSTAISDEDLLDIVRQIE